MIILVIYNLKVVQRNLLILFLLYSFPIFAFQADSLSVRHLEIDNGLSNNYVRCIYQDAKGFFWFGTRDGLNRYDGYDFRIFRNEIDNKFSLIHNIIHSISSDSDNRIWVGTRKGLSIYNDRTGIFTNANYRNSLKNRSLPVASVIRDIFPGTQQSMLVATEGVGLLRFKKGSHLGEQVPLLMNGRKSFSYGVQSVRVDEMGREWAFVQNVGLCLFDKNHKALILLDAKSALALCIGVKGGKVFIGTNNGLFQYDPQTRIHSTIQAKDGSLAGKSILSITPDRHGNLYLGTNGEGVFSYNPENKGAQPLSGGMSNLLPLEPIYSIFIDKEDRKWIGTYSGGVTIVDPVSKTFRTWGYDNKVNSIPGNSISSFLETNEGRILIGTDGAGISLWDRKTNKFTNYRKTPAPESLSSNFISSFSADNSGQIWIGTFTEGVNRFDTKTKKVTSYKLIDPKSGIESKVAFTIFTDREFNTWAGTLRRGSLLGGLYLFNSNADRFELFDASLGDLFTMVQTRKGELWAGNLDQLIRIDKSKKHHSFFNLGYTVRVIYEDKQGRLWIGTEGGGIMIFDPKKGRVIAQLTTRDGLCNNSVLSIIPDDYGNLWLSTYFGVSAYNIDKHTFKNYYKSDGLQSNQFQINAGIKLRSGEIIFGGIKGFSIFDPGKIVSHSSFPNLFLTGISINNNPLERNPDIVKRQDKIGIREIEVPYNQAVFNFSFTALEFFSPEKISYKYFMEGWDRGWTQSAKDRKAVYTHISEGLYFFHVKSTNSEGQWNPNEIVLKIRVLPPWYRTWWAYVGYIAATFSLVLLYMRYRSAQTRLKYEVRIVSLESERKKAEYDSQLAHHEMERLAHEKERLINEQEKALSDKRMSFFTNISHEFRSPLSLIINPIEDLINNGNILAKEVLALNMVQRNARRMLSLVDQLLLFRKAEEGFENIKVSKLDIEELAREVFYCFLQQASTKKINYRFEQTIQDKEVYVDKIKIEIVLFNLISNAIKYTPLGGEIAISLTEDANSFYIAIEDSGPGIPDSAKEMIFERFYQVERNDSAQKSGFGIGLYLARLFMESHSGSLNYRNRIHGGSIFYISLLKGKEHLKSEGFLDGAEISEGFVSEIYPKNEIISTEPLEVSVEISPVSDKQSILIVDDEQDIRKYIATVFSEHYTVYQAENGEEALKIAGDKLPDLIITDFRMQGIDGIEFCQMIKSNPTLSYIPVILLTAISDQNVKLKSVQSGADDYINKPFEKDYLIARVANLLRNKNTLQNYFYNEITLQKNSVVVSEEYKKFLDSCILVVENHLTDSDFGIKSLAQEVGMSHSNLYKRVKSISGQSVNSFIRFIRLRKAAELMINSDHNVTEVAFRSGFNDAKYFGKQFSKLFGATPTEFIKKHRKTFNKKYKIK